MGVCEGASTAAIVNAHPSSGSTSSNSNGTRGHHNASAHAAAALSAVTAAAVHSYLDTEAAEGRIATAAAAISQALQVRTSVVASG